MPADSPDYTRAETIAELDTTEYDVRVVVHLGTVGVMKSDFPHSQQFEAASWALAWGTYWCSPEPQPYSRKALLAVAEAAVAWHLADHSPFRRPSKARLLDALADAVDEMTGAMGKGGVAG